MNTSPGTNLGQLLLRGFRWFDEALVTRLRAAGWPQLTRAHSLVFANLDHRGTRTAELARRTGVSRQALHKTVHELVDLGLVELRPDPDNRSARLVVATAEGWRSTAVALAIFAELEAELIERIGAADVTNLRRGLERDWGPPPPLPTSDSTGRGQEADADGQA